MHFAKPHYLQILPIVKVHYYSARIDTFYVPTEALLHNWGGIYFVAVSSDVEDR